MDLHEIKIAYHEVSSGELLNTADKELLAKAWEACEQAYAPYSQFRVGAAVRLSNNMIYKGNNQENSAYPSGLCAERVAVFSASAQHPGIKIEQIAVVAKTDSFKLSNPVTPCGACRQVLAEYEMLAGKPMRILLQSGSGKVWILEGIKNLLPLMFHGEELKK